MQMLFSITLLDIVVVAVVANIITDIYELLLEKILGKSRDWHLVGRWMINIPRGTFIIDPEDETGVVAGELPAGWVFHYVVAVLFATLYLLGVHFLLNSHPNLANAIGFGVVTVAAPWLIMMPGLGAGIFARYAERPNFVRIMSLSVHVVFGIGLYVGSVVAGVTN